MQLWTRLLVSFLLLGLTGCSGGTGTTAPPVNDPQAQEREAAVILASDVAAAEIEAEIAFAPMVNLDLPLPRLDDRDRCSVMTGTPQAGTITYTNCETPRGTLNGTITWIGSHLLFSTTRDLTFTRFFDGSILRLSGTSTWLRSHLASTGTRMVHRTGTSEHLQANTRILTESDLTWSWGRNHSGFERNFPSGTIHTSIFIDRLLVHEVLLTFDGTRFVLATVNGFTYRIALDQRGGRPQLTGPPPPGKKPGKSGKKDRD